MARKPSTPIQYVTSVESPLMFHNDELKMQYFIMMSLRCIYYMTFRHAEITTELYISNRFHRVLRRMYYGGKGCEGTDSVLNAGRMRERERERERERIKVFSIRGMEKGPDYFA